MLKEEGKKNFIRYCKNNQSNKYRLNAYHNYNEHKGYYVLTKGKYKIIYASIDLYSMHLFIKDVGINPCEIHINNLTYADLFDYMTFGRDDIKYDNYRQFHKNML